MGIDQYVLGGEKKLKQVVTINLEKNTSRITYHCVTFT